MCACVSAGAYRVQKRVSEPLALELQGVVNHQMWILRTELSSSGRVADAPNCWPWEDF